MTTTKRAVLAATCLALVMSAAAVSKSTPLTRPDAITITFSADITATEEPAVKKVLLDFEKRQSSESSNHVSTLLTRFKDPKPVPKIRVLLKHTRAPELVAELEADKRLHKSTIHLFAQDNSTLSPLVDKGLVEDLSQVPVPKEVGPWLLPECFHGKRFFLPFRPNMRLMYIDKASLEAAGLRAPSSVEEFRSMARRFKQLGNGPKVTLSLSREDDGDPAAVTVSEWILAFDGDPLVLNSPQSLQAFAFLQQLWKEGLVLPESVVAQYQREMEYLEGKISWLAQNWSHTSEGLASVSRLDDFVVTPGLKGHVLGGSVLGVPKGVSRQGREAALKLADYLMKEEAQSVLVRDNAWPSIREDAYQEIRPEYSDTFRAMKRVLDDGWWYRPQSVPYWPDVRKQMNEAVSRIVLRMEPVKPVLDELQERIRQAASREGAEYPPKGLELKGGEHEPRRGTRHDACP